ncbi:unnamed protein product [Adineta steineri]|uniref:Decapping nuclease n=1 Tax=Adineta steineri TaxID=433720 RepID=A0A814I4X3_9BILA|nr:unnamed protein product [Adineta steineri]CAF1277694.1 unnamed protein product [Adineta steineri]
MSITTAPDYDSKKPYRPKIRMHNPPIPEAILNRCVLIKKFQSNQNEINEEVDPMGLINKYKPHILNRFNVNRYLPDDHRAIQSYRDVLTIPAEQVPIFSAPQLNTLFPALPPNEIPQPKYSSLLPILIPAQAADIDFYQYDIVSERNSLLKIASTHKECIVGVVRCGKTLFLRRYDRRRANQNDAGYQFERMCTPGYDLEVEYKYLIEGYIGNFQTLITAQVHSVSEDDGLPIELKCPELKCSRSNCPQLKCPELKCLEGDGKLHLDEKWLQMFLGGVEKLKVGLRSGGRSAQLLQIVPYDAANMVDVNIKINFLRYLNQVLLFLQDNVQEARSYLLCRYRHDESSRDMDLFLYEVTDREDMQTLEFVPNWMLKKLQIRNT